MASDTSWIARMDSTAWTGGDSIPPAASTIPVTSLSRTATAPPLPGVAFFRRAGAGALLEPSSETLMDRNIKE